MTDKTMAAMRDKQPATAIRLDILCSPLEPRNQRATINRRYTLVSGKTIFFDRPEPRLDHRAGRAGCAASLHDLCGDGPAHRARQVPSTIKARPREFANRIGSAA